MMIGVSKLRCGGHVKYWNSLLTRSALKPFSLGLNTQYRTFSKKSDSKESRCCKDVAQTEGREVEPWPRSEKTPPGWAPPPNNDPYRIKLPETVVPPLPPPCDVKWTGYLVAADGGDQQGYRQGYQNQGYGYQGHEEQKEEEKDEGLLGILKSFFGRGKKDKGSDENQMIGLYEPQWALLRCDSPQ